MMLDKKWFKVQGSTFRVESLVERPKSHRAVIPAKAGINCLEIFWMPDQVRHDGLELFSRPLNL
jgi:hypothetical protein